VNIWDSLIKAWKKFCTSGSSFRDVDNYVFFKFLVHAMSCNITQQLRQVEVTHCIVPTRTKVKILQHNRLDANSFVLVKLWRQTKNCTNIFEGSITILGTEGSYGLLTTGSTRIFYALRRHETWWRGIYDKTLISVTFNSANRLRNT